MNDRWIVALAASAALGAVRPSPVPLLVGAVATVLALALQRPALLCVAVAISTSSLAQRAIDGLEGLDAAAVRAEVVLLTDPEPSFDGLRAEAVLDGRHVGLRASRSTAPSLVDRSAGEHLVVRGALRPIVAPDDWALVRHLAGELTLLRIEGWEPGAGPWRVANGLRRTILRGAARSVRSGRSTPVWCSATIATNPRPWPTISAEPASRTCSPFRGRTWPS